MSRSIIKVGTATCAPCKMLDAVLKDFPNVSYVDAHVDYKLTIDLGVTNVPTTIFYDKDKEYHRHVGLMSKQQIEDILKGGKSD